jgi:LysM repeat protein
MLFVGSKENFMKDKESVPSVIAAYRKRQERAERLLLVFWVGVMLLVVGAGYLIYRLLKPGVPPQALNITETATSTETIAPSTSTTTISASSATLAPEQTETPAPSQAPTASGITTYTVKEGETLVGIAGQFGINLPTLVALNPSITPEFLNVGDQLSVPVQGGGLPTSTSILSGFQTTIEYTVVANDTLAVIAERYGSTVNAIVQENNLDSPDQIRDGQTLRIPVNATPSPAPEATLTATPAP